MVLAVPRAANQLSSLELSAAMTEKAAPQGDAFACASRPEPQQQPADLLAPSGVQGGAHARVSLRAFVGCRTAYAGTVRGCLGAFGAWIEVAIAVESPRVSLGE